MIGCRDPLGIRPLVLGDLDGSFILASETCALDIMGASYVRDVEPGLCRSQTIGEELAQSTLFDADIVVPVPDSGTPAAIGYAQLLTCPLNLASFVTTMQGVILVEDSIVRGTTSQKIVAMVREAGAKEVICALHLRQPCLLVLWC
ncbi:Amidophosphoribosyltransferase [Nymphon striatum]|nr:Amidophosphoribosyltransferase [Nymphon striatum]